MAKDLKLVFLDENGKKKTLTPKAAREDLTTEEVKEVMENIVSLPIFRTDEVLKYAEVESAYYTETIITPVVEAEEK